MSLLLFDNSIAATIAVIMWLIHQNKSTTGQPWSPYLALEASDAFSSGQLPSYFSGSNWLFPGWPARLVETVVCHSVSQLAADTGEGSSALQSLLLKLDGIDSFRQCLWTVRWQRALHRFRQHSKTTCNLWWHTKPGRRLFFVNFWIVVTDSIQQWTCHTWWSSTGSNEIHQWSWSNNKLLCTNIVSWKKSSDDCQSSVF